MLHRSNILLLIGTLCVCGFSHVAWGVPAVKKLGMASGNNVQNTNVATTKKASQTSSNLSRASSIRSLGSTIKPVSVAKPAKTVNASGVDIDDRRLSLGKYIHTSGVNSGHIKPIGNSAEPQVSSDEFINLTDRVVQLENTVSEKQDILSPGKGIEIEDNVISVSEEIQGLSDTVADISEQLNEKVDVANMASNYYTKEDVYTKSETQQYVQQIVSQISHDDKGYVNTFDSTFLTD